MRHHDQRAARAPLHQRGEQKHRERRHPEVITRQRHEPWQAQQGFAAGAGKLQGNGQVDDQRQRWPQGRGWLTLPLAVAAEDAHFAEEEGVGEQAGHLRQHQRCVGGEALACPGKVKGQARIARRRIIHQNLGWALAYNVVALPFAALGWVTPGLAALGMAASSLVVTANALRLGRFDQGTP